MLFNYAITMSKRPYITLYVIFYVAASYLESLNLSQVSSTANSAEWNFDDLMLFPEELTHPCE